MKYTYEIEHEYDHIKLRLVALSRMLGVITDNMLAICIEVTSHLMKMYVYVKPEITEEERDMLSLMLAEINIEFLPELREEKLYLIDNTAQPFACPANALMIFEKYRIRMQPIDFSDGEP